MSLWIFFIVTVCIHNYYIYNSSLQYDFGVDSNCNNYYICSIACIRRNFWAIPYHNIFCEFGFCCLYWVVWIIYARDLCCIIACASLGIVTHSLTDVCFPLPQNQNFKILTFYHFLIIKGIFHGCLSPPLSQCLFFSTLACLCDKLSLTVWSWSYQFRNYHQGLCPSKPFWFSLLNSSTAVKLLTPCWPDLVQNRPFS